MEISQNRTCETTVGGSCIHRSRKKAFRKLWSPAWPPSHASPMSFDTLAANARIARKVLADGCSNTSPELKFPRPK